MFRSIVSQSNGGNALVTCYFDNRDRTLDDLQAAVNDCFSYFHTKQQVCGE